MLVPKKGYLDTNSAQNLSAQNQIRTYFYEEERLEGLYKCPQEFSPNLWQKISNTSKKKLCENGFTFPGNLGGELSFYTYIKAENKPIIIDMGTYLESPNKEVYLGQNLSTGEFLLIKTVSCFKNMVIEANQTIVAARNLKRLEALLFVPEKDRVYMATKLATNSISLDNYCWKEHAGGLLGSIELAISYLEELELINQSDVVQSYSDGVKGKLR